MLPMRTAIKNTRSLLSGLKNGRIPNCSGVACGPQMAVKCLCMVSAWPKNPQNGQNNLSMGVSTRFFWPKTAKNRQKTAKTAKLMFRPAKPRFRRVPSRTEPAIPGYRAIHWGGGGA